MKYVLTSADAEHIEYPGIDVFAYKAGDDFSGLSASLIRAREPHPRIWNEESDRVYLVMAGNGWFEIDGELAPVETGHVVFVPKKTTYSYGGEMEMFLVHSPAYQAGWDHHVPDAI